MFKIAGLWCSHGSGKAVFAVVAVFVFDGELDGGVPAGEGDEGYEGVRGGPGGSVVEAGDPEVFGGGYGGHGACEDCAGGGYGDGSHGFFLERGTPPSRGGWGVFERGLC